MKSLRHLPTYALALLLALAAVRATARLSPAVLPLSPIERSIARHAAAPARTAGEWMASLDRR